jgi:membrane protein
VVRIQILAEEEIQFLQASIPWPRESSMRPGEFVGLIRRLAAQVWSALVKTYNDFDRHNYVTYAATLAFIFLLSLFPLLIFLASLFAYIPLPDLFEQTLEIMAKVVPVDGMGVVRGVLKDVLSTNPKLLSFSIAGAIFAASGGFSSLIGLLNIAYDVPEGRPYWKTLLIAFALTLLTGLMVVLVLVVTVLGPGFGNWLAGRFAVGGLFAGLWPYIRWLLIAGLTILSVEAIYFLAPNAKQRFKEQLPGAVIAVFSWVAASWGFGWYVRHVAYYNHTFGALGAVVGLMMWFYLSGLTLVLGAEINAELLHSRGLRLPEKNHAERSVPSELQETVPRRAA